MAAPRLVLSLLFTACTAQGPSHGPVPITRGQPGSAQGLGVGTERGIWALSPAGSWALLGKNVGNACESRTETVVGEILQKQPRSSFFPPK